MKNASYGTFLFLMPFSRAAQLKLHGPPQRHAYRCMAAANGNVSLGTLASREIGSHMQVHVQVKELLLNKAAACGNEEFFDSLLLFKSLFWRLWDSNYRIMAGYWHCSDGLNMVCGDDSQPGCHYPLGCFEIFSGILQGATQGFCCKACRHDAQDKPSHSQ